MRHPRRLLVVAHAPSDNTRRLMQAVLRGARHPDVEGVHVRSVPPLEAQAEDVLAAHAVVLGTTENLGYMSGALKDFFDRIYYPCLEHTHGLPCALYVRAGHDGTGTRRAVESILTGLKWKPIQPPTVFRGPWAAEFEAEAEMLGLTVAAGLDAGLY